MSAMESSMQEKAEECSFLGPAVQSIISLSKSLTKGSLSLLVPVNSSVLIFVAEEK